MSSLQFNDDDLKLNDNMLLSDDDDDLILAAETEEDKEERKDILPEISAQLKDVFAIVNNQPTFASLRSNYWKILIVDDDPHVHKVTTLALQGFDFEQKPITLLSAFNAVQTKEMLAINPDIAVILMDVVMESHDTGLQLIKYIRDELKNTMVRIILRTGQPGEAPERSVIIDYDINDYKLKTEMTRRRLFTTIIAGLRSYRDLLTIERYRLQQIRMATIQHELNLAQHIQNNMLLPPNPAWEPLDMVCFTVPARKIGGDFYTYYDFNLPLADGPRSFKVKAQRYAVAVGDVSGKGMAAALLMAVSLVSFNSALRRIYSLSKRVIDVVSQPYPIHSLMRDLDEAINYYISSSRQNCAIAYVEITFNQSHETDNDVVMMRTANAGCIPPYIKRTDGSVEMLETRGFPLGQGLSEITEYKEIRIELSKGDFIILTTDGIIEANNTDNEMFGFDRLEQAIQLAPMTNATALLDHVKQTVFDYIGTAEQHDDMTIVVLGI